MRNNITSYKKLSVVYRVGRFAGFLVFVLSLSGYPIVAAFSEYLQIENRILTIPFRFFVIILCFISFATLRVAGKSNKNNHLFWISWWLFWALYVFRIVLDNMFSPESLKRPAVEYFLYSVGLGLIPAMAASRWAEEFLTSRNLPIILLFTSCLGLVLNLMVAAQQKNYSALSDLFGYRVETETLNPIALGHLGMTAFVISVWLFMTGKRLRLVIRLALIIAGFIGLVGIVASGSRGPLIAAVVVLLAMLWILGSRRYAAAIIIVSVGFGLLISIYYRTISEASSFLADRIVQSAFTDYAREGLFSEAINLISENPLLGSGIEPLHQYPHNLILESFLVVGIFTGIPFCYIIINSLGKITLIKYKLIHAGWIYILLLQNILYGMVSNSLYFSAPLWVLLAIVARFPVHYRPKNVRLKRDRRMDELALAPDR